MRLISQETTHHMEMCYGKLGSLFRSGECRSYMADISVVSVMMLSDVIRLFPKRFHLF
jgi:hypothetical protein